MRRRVCGRSCGCPSSRFEENFRENRTNFSEIFPKFSENIQFSFAFQDTADSRERIPDDTNAKFAERKEVSR